MENMMYDYPLVVDSGETFLNDRQLLGFIREKCGDIAADYVAQRIDTDEMPSANRIFLKRLKIALEEISADISTLDADTEELNKLLTHELGRAG